MSANSAPAFLRRAAPDLRRRLRGAGFGVVRTRCCLRAAGRRFAVLRRRLRAFVWRRLPPNPALICFAESFRLDAIFLFVLFRIRTARRFLRAGFAT